MQLKALDGVEKLVQRSGIALVQFNWITTVKR